MEGSTIIGDAADFLKNYPQYTLEDYLFNLSISQIQFLLVDNTHIKYLKGKDKKIWKNYTEALAAQEKLENFLTEMTMHADANGEIKYRPNK